MNKVTRYISNLHRVTNTQHCLIEYEKIKTTPSTVYVIQEIAGTRDGRPKINKF